MNPDAKRSDKYLSKGAATRLRHGDPRRFINGVAMDINSFVDMMIRNHEYIGGGTRNQNWSRYRASGFSSKEFKCEWDLDDILHMLEV